MNIAAQLTPHAANETATLRTVVLGLPDSPGATPSLEEAYDATSYRSVELGIYPQEKDIKREMDSLLSVLERYQVEVLRPTFIPNYNQIFARDVAFTIEDRFFVANMIEDRMREVEAFRPIFDRIAPGHLVEMPKEAHAEGGDVLLYNDYLFIGTCGEDEFDRYKTARTNHAGIEFFKKQFPNKKVVPLHLRKHDTDPTQSILHLDCTFQPVAEGKAVVYPGGFVREEEYQLIERIFGRENLFVVTQEEAMSLSTNLFSLSPRAIISEERFERLNHHLATEWNMVVEAIPYHEISKEGGLLRCSTCPIVRD